MGIFIVQLVEQKNDDNTISSLLYQCSLPDYGMMPDS